MILLISVSCILTLDGALPVIINKVDFSTMTKVVLKRAYQATTPLTIHKKDPPLLHSLTTSLWLAIT